MLAITLISLALIVVFFMLRLPIAFAFGLTVLCIAFIFDRDIASAFSVSVRSFEGYSLVALPLFIYLGVLMERGGLGQLLIAGIEALFARVQGAIIPITVFSCALFGAVAGAGGAAIAAIGTVVIPRGEQRGFSRGFMTALVACSSVITLLIPPSIPMLVYALLIFHKIKSLINV